VILTVEVTDGDNEDSTTVDIAIKDINDQSPIFEREIYEVTIPEDSPVGMPVEQLKATDADIGANAQITYRIQVHIHQHKNELKLDSITLIANTNYPHFMGK
jgi:Cadherin domain